MQALIKLMTTDVVGFPLWLILGSWCLSALFFGIVIGQAIGSLDPTKEGD